MTGRHHRRWWDRHPLGAAAVALAAVAVLVVGVGAAVGPRPDVDQVHPIVAQPTSGPRASGTKPWPTVIPPSIGASGYWNPDATSTSSSPTIDRPTAVDCGRCGERSPVTTTSAAPTSAAAEEQTAEAAAADPEPGVALELLALVNRDRLANGCGSVMLHPSLVEQSQGHAEDQAADDAMYHSGGVDGFDTWGENVAYGYDTAAAVHDGWMGSPPHRTNILNCNFTVMGAGAADSPSGVRYWTEQFAA